MEKSRGNKLNQFYAQTKPDSFILDVGVSNNEHNSQVNLFLKNFRFPPNQYVGLAIENLTDIATENADFNFVEYSGRTFPFRDKAFDWCFSNAVIEHVGDRKCQIDFVNEMVRVSRSVFLTTPNLYFPIESHTNAAFIHWNKQYFYHWCKINKPYWNRENLNLLSHRDLYSILHESNAERFRIIKNRTLGYPMTFSVIINS